MTNVLLVEDLTNPKYRVIEGISKSQGISELFQLKVDMKIWKVNLHVVSCLRDAALWICDNTHGKLITILDGQFPALKDSPNTDVLYRDVLLELKHNRDTSTNYLIPFSSDEGYNKDMAKLFLADHSKDKLLSEGGKSPYIIEKAFESFLPQSY